MEKMRWPENSRIPFLTLILALATFSCNSRQPPIPEIPADRRVFIDTLPAAPPPADIGTGALLLSRFPSLEAFKGAVKIEFSGSESQPEVRLTHRSGGREVRSILKPGVSEYDLRHAFEGGFWDRVQLALTSFYVVRKRKELVRIEILSRWRSGLFGEGDVAFYDLAETMAGNISRADRKMMSKADLSEKGYLNTFNHVISQAMITSLFSEEMADFIADIHERYHMPQLITGVFSKEQIADRENGPLDNYLDLINNEWGQELGKELKTKYNLSKQTRWTPELLADYLNEIQQYHGLAFRIGFEPFLPSDEIVLRYTAKLNGLLHRYAEMTRDYV